MKYWAYINDEIMGPFEKEKLLELSNFTPASLICPQTPVGEKTEDWKEASNFPEVSAMLNLSAPGALKPQAGASGTSLTAPSVPGSPPPAPVEQTAPPLGQQTGLTPSPLPPFPAQDGINLPQDGQATAQPAAAAPEEPGKPAQTEPDAAALGFGTLKGDGKVEHPATEFVRNASASFDPMTISQIGRRTKANWGAETKNDATDSGAAQPPKGADGPAPEDDLSGKAPQPEVPAAHEPLPAADSAIGRQQDGDAAKTRDTDSLTRQELNSQLAPIIQKLEQVNMALASTGAAQFQRELLGRLALLEGAVSEIKTALSAMADSGAKTDMTATLTPKQPKTAISDAPRKENSGFVFGAQPPAEENKADKQEKSGQKTEIVDSGRKRSKLLGFLAGFLKLIFKLALTAAVLFGAVFGLKQYGIFDATKFIPFPIPFLTDQTAGMAAQGPQAMFPKEQTADEPAAAEKNAPAKEEQAGAAAPAAVYFVRNYAVRPGGLTLENAIIREAAKAGGDTDNLNWEGKSSQAGETCTLAAVIPSKNGKDRITFTYEANIKQKTVKPLDDTGKTALDALRADSVAKNRATKAGRQGRSRQRAAPAEAASNITSAPQENPAAPANTGKKPAARAAPGKTRAPASGTRPQTVQPQTEPDEEYEYVDEEEGK